ncbi:hypothetical protein EB118_25805, partial [bacterium]|nr:hypothetical protein [bacterium]
WTSNESRELLKYSSILRSRHLECIPIILRSKKIQLSKVQFCLRPSTPVIALFDLVRKHSNGKLASTEGIFLIIDNVIPLSSLPIGLYACHINKDIGFLVVDVFTENTFGC